MSTKIAPISASPDTGLAFTTGSSVRSAAPRREAPAQDQADLRLIIEEDSSTGSYIYRTIDRRTGEVVNQFPAETVLKLKREGTSTGAVISTSV